MTESYSTKSMNIKSRILFNVKKKLGRPSLLH